MRLSILCATQGARHAWPFIHEMLECAARCHGELLIVADGHDAWNRVTDSDLPPAILARGGLHHTMGHVAAACAGEYILFLDDDERCPTGLVKWLESESYSAAPLWKFPRAWLWGDTTHFITTPPHWPDFQRRLGRRDAVVVPTEIHKGWIEADTKAMAPFAIEHHKLLLHSRESREALVGKYEAVRPGAGERDFYVPEAGITPLAVSGWSG